MNPMYKKNRILMKRLTLLIFLGCFLLDTHAQIHFDVEGHAKIRGNLDISHMTDTSSLFIGRNARINYFNTTERKNTIVGVHSLFNPQSGDNAGSFNSIFGYDAGLFNRGNNNSFFGFMAGQQNRGFSNSFYGYSAGTNNQFGASNVFVGYRSGFNNDSGSSNVFLGYQAGSGNNSGGNNTFVGANAGNENGAGTNNTYIGANTNQLNNGDTLDKAIAIGYFARADCNSCAVIGGTGAEAVQVGIGVNTPEARLHIHEQKFTRLKLSNDVTRDISIDLVMDNDGGLDRDWRITNTSGGNLRFAYHNTHIDTNTPTTLIDASSSYFRPGSNGTIDLGGSFNRWETVYAKAASLSALLKLEPTSEPAKCSTSIEGTIYYDSGSKRLRLCTSASGTPKWTDIN